MTAIYAKLIWYSLAFLAVLKLSPLGGDLNLILACAVGALPFASGLPEDKEPRKPMKTSDGVLAFSGIVTLNWLMTLVSGLFTKPVLVTDLGGTLPALLYICLIGPAAEELIYRRTLCRAIMPYGRAKAVVVSALMFGLMHHDPAQGLSAGVTGLIYAHVYLEHGLLASTVLHVLNNSLAELLPRLQGKGMAANTFIALFMLASLVLAIAAAVRAVKAARRGALPGNPVPPKTGLFSNPLLILTILLDTFLTFRGA